MENKEHESFKERMVLVVCFAGSDRSELIAGVLNSRGYVASYGGVSKNDNYVTEDDLLGIGSVIFTTQKVRDIFKQDKPLNKILKKTGASIKIIGITESDKEEAIRSGDTESLKETISHKLDGLGYRDRNLYFEKEVK